MIRPASFSTFVLIPPIPDAFVWYKLRLLQQLDLPSEFASRPGGLRKWDVQVGNCSGLERKALYRVQILIRLLIKGFRALYAAFVVKDL